MPFQYLSNVPVEEAKQKYLEHLLKIGLSHKSENITVKAALNRITSEATYAKICAPHYNACAMDGIALKANLSFGATETTPIEIKDKDFVWVNTGDPLPKDCDAVVMVEDVVEGNGFITLYSAAIPWQHVRQIGEDISAGDMIVPSYTLLSPASLGAMLAAGVTHVIVVTRPVIGIIPSGNELVSSSGEPDEGEIIEFNSTIFSGMLQEWGCEPKVYPITKDDVEEIQGALNTALGECDAIILNAGSSAGNKDYALDAINKVGDVILHGIAIKPGKPTILAVSKHAEEKRVVPIIGLPGYPVSGILVLEELFKPVIQALTCNKAQKAAYCEAVVSRRLTSTLKYHEFIRARLGNVGGRLVAVPLNRGAGVVSSFVKADGIINIPLDTEGVEAGESVQVQMLRPMEEIQKTLVITGSHDPLLDEITDIMKRNQIDSLVASSHVGSMGGIMALRRGEAHMGGIHLLDEATGTYNIPYLKRYFPQGSVILVECVQRLQGLIIPKGNPKNIKGISDLVGASYVNRQKGSGTRILIDYLVKQQRINPDEILNYEREEFTHTAVAAAIAAGTADVGLGIYSASKIYDLDFVPVCDEQYDLLIAQEAFTLPSVQELLCVLKSKAFALRLNKLGGYTLKKPGEIRPWN